MWQSILLIVSIMALGCGSGGNEGVADAGTGAEIDAEGAGNDTWSLPLPDLSDTVASSDGVDLESPIETYIDAGHPPETVVMSDLTCKDFYLLCVSQCPLDTDGLPEEACFDACRETLSIEGEAALDTFLMCLDTSECDAEPDDSAKWNCYVNHCDDAYFGCFHGDEDCASVLKCIQACPQGDGQGACVVTCTQDGEPDAQKQLFKILKCIGENCCPDDAAQCRTPAGQQCGEDVFQVGGACFVLGTACIMGTY